MSPHGEDGPHVVDVAERGEQRQQVEQLLVGGVLEPALDRHRVLCRSAVCVRARVRVRVRACVCARACVCVCARARVRVRARAPRVYVYVPHAWYRRARVPTHPNNARTHMHTHRMHAPHVRTHART